MLAKNIMVSYFEFFLFDKEPSKNIKTLNLQDKKLNQLATQAAWSYFSGPF